MSLRERKREATQKAIERVAVDLALTHGYENVTVEMICEASEVSQRTFFNYFGSKEGVIIGARPPEPSQADIDKFKSKRDSRVLVDFVELVTSAFSDQEPDMELFEARKLILQRTPQLMNAELAKIGDLEGRFVNIVISRFESQGRPGTAKQLEEEARMIVSLASGVMRYLMYPCTTSHQPNSPQAKLRNAIEVLNRLSHSDSGLGIQ